MRLLPKYKQWVHEKYILERLIPIVGETDLVEKVSYESAWIFQDKNGNYLPPFYDGCKLIVESIYAAIDKKNTFVKYKDKNVSPEERKAELERVEAKLFGNETDVTDALAYNYGVGFTTSKTLQ